MFEDVVMQMIDNSNVYLGIWDSKPMWGPTRIKLRLDITLARNFFFLSFFE